MKTSRLYLIVTGQVQATDYEAALIMQAVRVAHENLAAKQASPYFSLFCKERLEGLNAITAQTEEFP